MNGTVSTDNSRLDSVDAGDVYASGDEDDVGPACLHCLLPSGGDRELKCDICLQHYHQKCTAMTAKIFDIFIVFADITDPPCDRDGPRNLAIKACNKTSLSRKPCIPDEKLLWNAIKKSWSLFQNPS